MVKKSVRITGNGMKRKNAQHNIYNGSISKEGAISGRTDCLYKHRLETTQMKNGPSCISLLKVSIFRSIG